MALFGKIAPSIVVTGMLLLVYVLIAYGLGKAPQNG
jgi:hypothetical protein